MTRPEDVLRELYRAFNARMVDELLAALHPNVAWPNGWEGGWLHGRDAVRAYWLRQWAEINPTVEPIAFTATSPDAVRVSVHQVVRDRTGAVIVDTNVTHTYAFDGGLIRRMDIDQPVTE